MSARNGTLSVVFVATVLAGIWILTLVNGVRLIRFQERMVEAVETGNSSEVLSLLDQLDPEGTGTVSDWTGAEEEDRPGFEWLFTEWRRMGHTEGAVPLFERWVEAIPSFDRSELRKHLEWLRDCEGKVDFRDLYTAMLERELDLDVENLPENRLDWLTVASGDLDLILFAWERVYDAGMVSAFPDSLEGEVTSRENLALEGVLDRALRVMGLLEPASGFQLLECPWELARGYGKTWIEWFDNKIFSQHATERRSVRRDLEERFFPEAGSDTPGMFLLKCLTEPSATQDWNEIFVSSLVPGLEHFESLPRESKAGVAGLLARHVISFRDEEGLREWVRAHHFANWKQEEIAVQNTVLREHSSAWRSDEVGNWVHMAAKLGHPEDTLPLIEHFWGLQLERQSLVKSSLRSNQPFREHPFHLVELSRSGLGRRSGEGGSLNPEGFRLLLAIARVRDMRPCNRMIEADEITILDGRGKVPWESASVDELHGMLVQLGEHFREDPVRFLIDSSICNNYRLLNSPEDLARFQALAWEDESPGGWLVDDLADLFPLWMNLSDAGFKTLLDSGGHLPTLASFNQYLQDVRAPVSSRVTFAMTALPRAYTETTRQRHTERMPNMTLPEPHTDAIALEFAREISEGRWSADEFPADVWNQLMEEWLNPFRRDQSGVVARAEARRLLLETFEALSKSEIASLAAGTLAEDKEGLDRAVDLFKIHASLLRLEGNDTKLSAFRDELDNILESSESVFRWIPREVTGWDRFTERIIAERLLYEFRARGGTTAEPGEFSNPAAVTEATATFEAAEWIRFNAGVLDQMQGSLDASGESAKFYALLPGITVTAAKDVDDNARAKWFLREAANFPEIDEHQKFFSLALPPLVRQVLKEKKVAEEFLTELKSDSGVSLAPGMRKELEAAARTMVSIHHGRYLDSLRDPEIPLAQRWLAANYFLLSRQEFGTLSPLPSDSWDEQDKSLVETSLDLLVETVDRRLPVWEIVDRGLGDFDVTAHQKTAVLAAFRNLVRNDPEGQAQRAADLLRPDRMDAILAGPGDRFLAVLHNTAVYAEHHSARRALFSRASADREFNRRIQWLSLCRDWRGLAEFLPGQLQHLDSLGAGDFLDPPPDALPQILEALPEGNKELELLARVLVTPRWKIDPLMNPSMKDLPGDLRDLGGRFLSQPPGSAEIEKFVLNHLPVYLRDFPALKPWVEGKIDGRGWDDYLRSDSQPFLNEWPYRAKYLEVLADSGDFKLLAEMMPDAAWFAGEGRAVQLAPSARESREEMVWMGFARAIAGALCFGNDQARLDAAVIAEKLLKSPPVLGKGRTEASLHQSAKESNRRRWSIDREIIQELAEYGTAAVLIATLNDPLDSALRRSDISTLPGEPFVPGGHRIEAGSAGSFFASVASLSVLLEGEKRERLFMRALETDFFKNDDDTRNYPCYSSAGSYYHTSVSDRLFTRLAELRMKENPEDPAAIADYGLMLWREEKAKEALPLLERAFAGLREDDTDKRNLRDLIEGAIQSIGEKE